MKPSPYLDRRLLSLLVLGLITLPLCAADAPPPNVILCMADDLGWQDVGFNGNDWIQTPNLDQMASQGIRFERFYSASAVCSPTRASCLTGRNPFRTGVFTANNGILRPEEITIAELLKEKGYATGMFGKWHLGQTKGRFPTDQGFDEWYGIPNSSDESLWPDSDYFLKGTHPAAIYEHVFAGRKGAEPKKLKVYDSAARLEIDGEITDKAKDFIQRQAKAKKPFFAFLPYTQTHGPVKPSAEFKGATGNGPWADVLAQTDAYVGELLDQLDQLEISENTIVIFTADNGPEMLPGHNGWSGPWRGSYFTGLEGSLRVPFIARWPNNIPAGVVTNEIVHEIDLFATFAKFAGGRVPNDRTMDSIDQSAFFLGQKKKSDREGIVVYVGNDIFGVKWRNWKMMFKELERGTDALIEYPLPRFYNLYTDPKEEYPLTRDSLANLWVRWPAGQVLTDHLASLKKEVPVPPGTPDPYLPSKK